MNRTPPDGNSNANNFTERRRKRERTTELAAAHHANTKDKGKR